MAAENTAIITIIAQKNLDPGLIGQKAVYLQERLQGLSVPWTDNELAKIARTSLATQAFMVTNINNEDKPEQKVTIMVEPCLPPEELIILGGGHIAKPLAHIANLVGFKVTVIDERPGFACEERFPEADRLITMPFEKLHEILQLGSRSYVVVVTQGHRHDWVCMQQVLKYPLAYLGVIGSKRKIALTKEKMLAAGYENSEIENIYMPIGLDIGAETPEEIAVSIAAELIKHRYGGMAASLSGKSRPGAKSIDLAADAQFDMIKKAVSLARHETPAAVATIFAAEGSTPRKAGSRMIVKEDGSIYGTIGGGKGEAIVCEEALKVIRDGRPVTVRVNMGADMDDELGMICGGDIQVFVESVKSFASGFKDGIDPLTNE